MMIIVWIAFAATAILLSIGAWAAWRYKGEGSTAVHSLTGFLLTLAAGTALFPVLLPSLGTALWVGGYIAFVAALTAIMTITALMKARLPATKIQDGGY